MPTTTVELETRTGMEYLQLRNWSRWGLLEPPEIRSGRLVWPEGTADRVREIQNLKKLGLSLSQIGDTLKKGVK